MFLVNVFYTIIIKLGMLCDLCKFLAVFISIRHVQEIEITFIFLYLKFFSACMKAALGQNCRTSSSKLQSGCMNWTLSICSLLKKIWLVSFSIIFFFILMGCFRTVAGAVDILLSGKIAGLTVKVLKLFSITIVSLQYKLSNMITEIWNSLLSLITLWISFVDRYGVDNEWADGFLLGSVNIFS